jgi:5-(hydroxymethyl)furfural/furfural oxidase
MIDYLILGGGSAGCVLAARLTEDPKTTVTLVEAGRDLRPETMSPGIRSRYPGRAFMQAENLWPGLTVQLSAAPGVSNAVRTAVGYEQARVLGGGSAINAMVANRGAPGDYDEWGALGADGWSWDAVFPYFRKLESDRDVDDAYHGQAGPITVRRLPREKWSGYTRAIVDTAVALGHPLRTDQNGLWEDGVYPGVIASTDVGERIPASIAYLTPAVRRRPNLRILTDRFVERIVLDGRRAVAAEIAPADPFFGTTGRERLEAREIVVSTGALHTPALLMRSGIGSAADLARHGIAVQADLPGVGRNLMEHVGLAMSSYIPPAARLHNRAEHHDNVIIRYSSGVDHWPGDMHVAVLARTGWHAVGQRLGSMFCWVNKTDSRGFVTLRSADPRQEPLVDFRLMSDPRDLEKLKGGFRLMAKIMYHATMEGMRHEVFPAGLSDRVRRYTTPGARNAVLMGLFGAMLDYSFGMRGMLIEKVVTRGVDLRALLADDAALTAFVAASGHGVWHASGTCRMGAADDPMAVTGAGGLVRGVAGLRVCDASLMPSIPRANTNMPTMMMAERIADLIKTGEGGR